MEIEQPNHPVGQPNVENAADGYDRSVFSAPAPTFAEVLEARADRVAMVRGFLAAATPEDMSTVRRNPWGLEHPETTLSCLHTILREEWEHHRYAVRDLAAIAAGPGV